MSITLGDLGGGILLPSNGKTPRLPPLPFVSRLLVTIKKAPRMRVVDVAFDMVCGLHGYTPRSVLETLVKNGLVFTDDTHPEHIVIGLTKKGARLGTRTSLAQDIMRKRSGRRRG